MAVFRSEERCVSRWYRAYEGTVTDAKLAESALVAEVSRSVSIAAWHCILESAACVNNCGSYDTSPRRVAVILCEPPSKIEGLFAAFVEMGLIVEGSVKAWKKRQFESDSSTERSRKHRQNRGNGNATLQEQEATPPEAETDTETESKSSDDDTASGDAPKLVPEHVFEGYQTLAAEIGLSVPRDFTPERRQLVRGRVTQYSLDDFQTVFAKCRDSPFLRGDKGRTPLTFDWLMKKGNFQKTLEGNYDR
jgi:hypothetical protein